MESRRKFLKASAAALTVAATRPIFGAQGANDRIRLAVIGCGNRSGRVFDAFARQSNVQWVAGAEVNKAKLDSFMTPARQTFKLDMVGDYRRILERKDVDAVLIGTPDHWHSQQTIDAISAGKDVYVEKPAANTVPRLNAMLDAYRKGKQVVQVGTQQRSWDHFLEAKKLLDSGVLGNVTHIYIVQPGVVRAAEGGRAGGAGGARLGYVAGAGAEEGVQAKPARIPGVVRLRRRAGRGLGCAPCRRGPLVHERRQAGAGQDGGNRGVFRGARCRSRTGP